MAIPFMPLRFDLAVVEIPILLADPETKDERKYVLREFNGAERDKYLNSVSSRMKIDPQGNSTIRSFDGLHANLIKRCLYDSDGQLVTEEVIQSFPARVQTALFEKAQEICGLGEKVVTDEGND